MPFVRVNITVVVFGLVSERTGLTVVPFVFTVKVDAAGRAGESAKAMLNVSWRVFPAACTAVVVPLTGAGIKLCVVGETVKPRPSMPVVPWRAKLFRVLSTAGAV
jgi:hypothetical protein